MLWRMWRATRQHASRERAEGGCDVEQPAPGQGTTDWTNPEALKIAFDEYKFLSESTDDITDRRQTVNTLFVSINALFLTGVGYLLFQFFQSTRDALPFLVAFFIIAVITSLINSAWLSLSESNRKLVDLRIRYLKQLEKHLRQSDLFPIVEIPLKDYETRGPGANVEKTRGTYTLEDVLYNPGAKKQPFGFSRAEQRIGKTFTWAYRAAFLLAVFAYVYAVVLPGLGVNNLPHL
jgi:hypothetical protein